MNLVEQISESEASLEPAMSFELWRIIVKNPTKWYNWREPTNRVLEIATNYVSYHACIDWSGDGNGAVVYSSQPIHVFRSGSETESVEGLYYSNGVVGVLRKKNEITNIWLWMDKKTKDLFNYPD